MRQWDPLGVLLVEGHTEWAEWVGSFDGQRGCSVGVG